MNIQQVRVLNIVMLLVLLSAGAINLLWYLLAMYFSLEVLNCFSVYRLNRAKVYNAVFSLYSLVLLRRIIQVPLSEKLLFLVNSAEHLLFGVIICIKFYIYMEVLRPGKIGGRLNRALLALVLFNMLGFLNEIFQNYLCNRAPLLFIADSIKDLQMNFFGACIFALAVPCQQQRLRTLQANTLRR